jgi:hypothetical protein
MTRSPQIELLVPWESWSQRWRDGFGPALGRSAPRWSGECEFSPARTAGMGLSGVAHLALSVALVFAVAYPSPPEAVALKPFDPADYEVKILTAPYLPQLEDAGGAESGVEGRSGGREAYHPRQVIRVARGVAEVDKVIEAPKLRLPMTSEAIANVIVVPRVLPTVPVTANRSVPKGLEQLAPDPVAPSVDVLAATSKRSLDLAVEAVPPSPETTTSRVPVVRGLDAPEVVAPTVEVADMQLPARTVDMPALEVAQPAAPPARADADLGTANGAAVAGGSAAGSPDGGATEGGFVLSPQAGSTVGTSSSVPGALAMSPNGSGTVGLGGSGGGTGTGIGTGPGSGRAGAGPGAGRTGTGRGDSTVARGGLTPGAGPGGTGSGSRPGSLPGVTIRGGNVTLPSFATAQPSATGPAADLRNRPPLTVVATARSGGALATYGKFGGARVYTIYIDTKGGIAVLQYSEVARKGGESFDVDLTAPEPLYFPVPEKVGSRILISCTLGEDGKLRNMRIVEGATSDVAASLSAALADWIFRPVMRGDTPVAVQAMVGFSVDTR